MENTVETEIVPELPPRIEQPRAKRPRHPPDRLTYYAPGQVDPANVSHVTATTPSPPPFTWPPPLMFSVNKPFPFVHQPPVHWPPLVNTPNPFPTPYPFSQPPSVNTPYHFPTATYLFHQPDIINQCMDSQRCRLKQIGTSIIRKLLLLKKNKQQNAQTLQYYLGYTVSKSYQAR